MSNARDYTIQNQSQFYRNAFRKMLTLAFVVVIIAYGLLALIVYQHLNRPAPKYFVTTSGGRLIEIEAQK